MKVFGKIFLCSLVAFLALWQIPWLIRYFGAKPSYVPFTLYSSMIGDFAMIVSDGDGLEFLDRGGRSYTEEQFDSILPLFYVRQLISEGRFPDSIAGRAVNAHDVQRSNFFFNTDPSDINRKVSGIYFLMESHSGRVDLEMPDDAFRFTSRGIEFIDMAGNEVIGDKSGRFTSAMSEAGFSFPPKCVSGNPTTRKEYDEGYMLIDAADRLFHFKMSGGEPYVRPVVLPEGIIPEHVFITEFSDRSMIAVFTDVSDRMFAVRMPGYEVVGIGSGENGCTFNPEEEGIYIIGNLIDWTVRISSDDTTRYFAINADDLSLMSSMEYPEESSWAEKVPGIRFTSVKDRYVRPVLRM